MHIESGEVPKAFDTSVNCVDTHNPGDTTSGTEEAPVSSHTENLSILNIASVLSVNCDPVDAYCPTKTVKMDNVNSV